MAVFERAYSWAFWTSLILLTHSAWAIAPQTPEYVCSRLNGSERPICDAIISHGTFDPLAAGECDSFEDQHTTNACMKIIANKKFQQNALLACDRFKGADDTNACLQVIAGKHYSDDAVGWCDAVDSTSDTLTCFKKYASKPGSDLIYAWVDDGHKTCGSYTRAGHFVSFADSPSKCASSGFECLRGAGVLASTATASIEGTLYHLVPEIMALPDGATVPIEAYSKYSPNLIAASLVGRLHANNESKANTSRPAYDYQTNAMVQMRFNASYIDSIKENGFLNQHQTQHSNGSLSPERRANVENSLMHVRLEQDYQGGMDNPINQVRPKYAFLTFQKDTDGQQHEHLERMYGNVIAVFKDEVKNRTTFTPVDSLNGNYGLDDRIGAGRVQAYTFKYRSNTPLPKTPDPTDDRLDYWEAQVWGKLSVRDVSYFLVSCPGDEAIADDAFESLKSTGVPIYQCEFVDDHSHFEKGNQIFPGDRSALPPRTPESGTLTSRYSIKKAKP